MDAGDASLATPLSLLPPPRARKEGGLTGWNFLNELDALRRLIASL